MNVVPPGQPRRIIEVALRHGTFIGGKRLAPTHDNKVRVLQEEIFGPVRALTTFSDELEHYSQTKNLQIAHKREPLGLF
jgi:acyl-CoA reductase-like NAD-dependent aldehyde dehydrogenase